MLLQSKRITRDTARALYCQCGCAVSQHLADLDLVEEHEHRARTELSVSQAWRMLASQHSEWKTYAAVEEWLAEFHVASTRRRFLVLHGPTKVGKSCFARALAEREGLKAYAVNMAGNVLTPNLRRLVSSDYGYLLLEEASCEFILENRMLMQGFPMMIQLGQSTTGRFGYEVSTFNMRIVVTTNEWTTEVRKLSADHRAWLADNAVVVSEIFRFWKEPWDDWY